VENYFGVADVINALPLLYHAGDWWVRKGSTASGGAYCLPHDVAWTTPLTSEVQGALPEGPVPTDRIG
jgi:hypothetical protein